MLGQTCHNQVDVRSDLTNFGPTSAPTGQLWAETQPESAKSSQNPATAEFGQLRPRSVQSWPNSGPTLPRFRPMCSKIRPKMGPMMDFGMPPQKAYGLWNESSLRQHLPITSLHIKSPKQPSKGAQRRAPCVADKLPGNGAEEQCARRNTRRAATRNTAARTPRACPQDAGRGPMSRQRTRPRPPSAPGPRAGRP